MGNPSLCADVRCQHRKGWHRRGAGSCLECGCVEFNASDEKLIDEIDDKLLAQWRHSGLNYVADVVEALLCQIARVE